MLKYFEVYCIISLVYLSQSLSIRGFPKLSRDFSANLGQCGAIEAISDYRDLSWDILEKLGLSQAISVYLLLSRAISIKYQGASRSGRE